MLKNSKPGSAMSNVEASERLLDLAETYVALAGLFLRYPEQPETIARSNLIRHVHRLPELFRAKFFFPGPKEGKTARSLASLRVDQLMIEHFANKNGVASPARQERARARIARKIAGMRLKFFPRSTEVQRLILDRFYFKILRH